MPKHQPIQKPTNKGETHPSSRSETPKNDFEVSPSKPNARILQRAIQNPTIQNLTPSVMLALQRKYGNRAVQQLVQRAIQDQQNVPSSVQEGSTRLRGKSRSINPVIQRSFGMELQTSKNKFYVGNEKGDRKDVIYIAPTWKLEVDSGADLEFVTEPLDTLSDLMATLNEMRQLVQKIRSGMVKGTDSLFVYAIPPEVGWIAPEGSTIRIDDIQFEAQVQSTEGVPLDKIPELMKEHVLGTAGEIKGLTGILSGEELDEKAGKIKFNSPKVKGVVEAILMYLNRTRYAKPQDDHGPKSIFTLLARTDFHAMYKILNETEQAEFRGILGLSEEKSSFYKEFLDIIGVSDLNERVFPNGYKVLKIEPESKAIESKEKEIKKPEYISIPGPTLKEWFDSIIKGDKDLLSPPPGFENFEHTEERQDLPYSMGTMGMHGDLAVFEMRGYGSSRKSKELKNLTVSGEVLDFAAGKFANAMKRNPVGLTEGVASKEPKQEMLSDVNWLASRDVVVAYEKAVNTLIKIANPQRKGLEAFGAEYSKRYEIFTFTLAQKNDQLAKQIDWVSMNQKLVNPGDLEGNISKISGIITECKKSSDEAYKFLRKAYQPAFAREDVVKTHEALSLHIQALLNLVNEIEPHLKKLLQPMNSMDEAHFSEEARKAYVRSIKAVKPYKLETSPLFQVKSVTSQLFEALVETLTKLDSEMMPQQPSFKSNPTPRLESSKKLKSKMDFRRIPAFEQRGSSSLKPEQEKEISPLKSVEKSLPKELPREQTSSRRERRLSGDFSQKRSPALEKASSSKEQTPLNAKAAYAVLEQLKTQLLDFASVAFKGS